MDEKNFPYISLCEVIGIESNGVRVLKRLIDLKNNKLQPQQMFSTLPQERFLKNIDCDLSLGSIGVFGWRIERTKNGGKYLSNRYYSDKSPIEIIILENCTNKGDLRSQLWSGINFKFSTKKVLIAYPVAKNIYRGVFCKEDDFEQIGDKKVMSTVLCK